MSMRDLAIMRHEQMKLREHLLRLQAFVLVENGVDISHSKEELLKLIGKDCDENSKKLEEFHRLIAEVRKAVPVVSVRSKDGVEDHGQSVPGDAGSVPGVVPKS